MDVPEGFIKVVTIQDEVVYIRKSSITAFSAVSGDDARPSFASTVIMGEGIDCLIAAESCESFLKRFNS